jgi:hypothetical protein
MIRPGLRVGLESGKSHMSQICPRYVSDMSQICPRFVLDMSYLPQIRASTMNVML